MMSNPTQKFTIPPVQPSQPGQRYDGLIAVLEQSLEEARSGELRLGQVLDRLGEASFSLIFILLCLPLLQPISMGPVATIIGLNLIALGWQLIRGKAEPWLPERIRSMTMPARVWQAMLKILMWVVKISGWLSRPRLQSWVTGPQANRLIGSIVVVAGVLLLIPLPGIPLSNLFPALVVLFIGIAQLERDGAMLPISLFWLVVTLAYFGFLAYGVVFLGDQAFAWLSYRSLLPADWLP
ncbi:MAG TPA: exopolysaccharide biosynthesis protein [Anaerolineae bacterium]|nr:exopolysaccharide biosynthesis protein [Anaerolineae bacterium]HMR64636.1 exopolysaccharide biosynthesis protein [Anaerolineae bacterium]